jgi:hypothetical protein
MNAIREPTDFSAAAHAYEHAEHAGDRPLHRLDVIDAPKWPASPPRPALPGRPAGQVVTHTHRIEQPAGTAFKVGFGFAAGVAAFRVLVLIVASTVLAIGLGSLVMRTFPS